MRSLKERRIDPEILDTLDLADAAASLEDLVRLNEHFGGHSALLHALAVAKIPRSGRITLVDVGAASGDMARQVNQWNPDARVMSTDRIAFHLRRADGWRVAGDGFSLPLADSSVDYALSSLFLHHFTDGDVIRLLSEMRRVARRAVLAVDLHRRWIPYWFVPATRRIFGWDRVTVHDAAVSVAAAFRTEELASLGRGAGLRDVRVASHGLSFRLTLVGRV